jgi:hypothetical protein
LFLPGRCSVRLLCEYFHPEWDGENVNGANANMSLQYVTSNADALGAAECCCSWLAGRICLFSDIAQHLGCVWSIHTLR